MTDSSRAARQKPRRRPLQARSWATSLAVQEAFVRVLLERGYDGVTIREVAAVAGVGIGTFYALTANAVPGDRERLQVHLRLSDGSPLTIDSVTGTDRHVDCSGFSTNSFTSTDVNRTAFSSSGISSAEDNHTTLTRCTAFRCENFDRTTCSCATSATFNGNTTS
eukprot:gene32668-biopygen26940